MIRGISRLDSRRAAYDNMLFLMDRTAQGEFAFDPDNLDQNGKVVAYTHELRRGSLVVYAAPDSSALQKASYAARFDRFAIKASEE